jgi:DNA-binding CsgD family transcriptional regulator
MATQSIQLTKREKEILELIYLGYTDVEIAEQIDISKNTVRTHRENIRTKFKVNNTASLIREAVKLKLVG